MHATHTPTHSLALNMRYLSMTACVHFRSCIQSNAHSMTNMHARKNTHKHAYTYTCAHANATETHTPFYVRSAQALKAEMHGARPNEPLIDLTRQKSVLSGDDVNPQRTFRASTHCMVACKPGAPGSSWVQNVNRIFVTPYSSYYYRTSSNYHA